MKIASAIVLKDVRLYAYHGVLPQERVVGGWYTVSLRVHYNLMRAMESDEVGDTLDYSRLLEVVKTEMSIPSMLVEHVAGRIAKSIGRTFDGVERVELRLLKDNPPMGANTAGAGVEIDMTF